MSLIEDRAGWQVAPAAWGPLPAWLQLGTGWERGEEAVCRCQVASASCSCLPSPSWRASPYVLDRKQPHHVYNTMFAAVHLGTGSSESCHPARCCALSWRRKSKGAKTLMRGKASDTSSALICFSVRYFGNQVICFADGWWFCRSGW